MTGPGCEVRIFELLPDGSLEPLQDTDASEFGGTCPNVGDTFARWGLGDAYQFYSVQRRYFIDSPGDSGWAVIIRQVEPAAQIQSVIDAWIEETRFWREIDEKERQAELDQVRESLRKLTEKKAPGRQTTAKKSAAKKPTRKPRKRVLIPPARDK